MILLFFVVIVATLTIASTIAWLPLQQRTLERRATRKAARKERKLARKTQKTKVEV